MSMNNANISITADNKSSIDQTRQLTNAIENLNKNVSVLQWSDFSGV